MKKLIALVAVLLIASTTARADDTWKTISTAQDLIGLTSGNYKLATSIDVNNTFSVPASRTVVLDLNGNRLRYTGSDVRPVITVAAGSQLTLQNTGDVEYGVLTGGKNGGIFNNGTLIVDNVTISGNTAGEGGAIYNDGGTVTLTNTVITNNTANNGGAIYNDDGQITLTGVTISGNGMRGIFNRDDTNTSTVATITISGGTITNHTTNTDKGAAINNDSGDIILVDNAVINDNQASSQGGAIYNSGTVTIKSADIYGNRSQAGGAIYNNTTGHLLIEGGTIRQNDATVYGGGGVENHGALTLEGGSITGNYCMMNGGGIWVAADATVMVQGSPEVKENTSNNKGNENLYLKTGAVIQVSGKLNNGAQIDVALENAAIHKFTKNYMQNNPNSASAKDFFHLSGARDISLNNGDLWAMPTYSGFNYLDESGAVQNVNPMKVGEIPGKDVAGVSLGDGTFVLDQNTTFSERLTIFGDVKLILHSGTLTAQKGICVPENASLTVYTVSGEGGKIVATGSDGCAGIGGNDGTDGGSVTIVGGQVEATGGSNSAGIGGGHNSMMKAISIGGGTVKATGGTYGAGIGAGTFTGEAIYEVDDLSRKVDVKASVHQATITITGGNITADGGNQGGAGIGGGTANPFLATVNIGGGSVTATGKTGNLSNATNVGGAGIGAGANGSCYFFRYHQAIPADRYATISISGATVEANGAANAAAIGGGGQTTATPDVNATTTPACAIYEGGGANVNISGGTVTASAGESPNTGHQPQAIGRGGSPNAQSILPVSGSLEIYDAAMVRERNANNAAESNERVNTIRDNLNVKIERCTDHVAKYSAIDAEKHTLCIYCALTEAHNFCAEGWCTQCLLLRLWDNYAAREGDNKTNTDMVKDYINELEQLYTGEHEDDYLYGIFTLKGRTLYKDGHWNTLCLPFNISDFTKEPLFEGATVMRLNSASFNEGTGELELNFKEETEIVSGYPYLVKWEPGDDITDPIFFYGSGDDYTLSGSSYPLQPTEDKIAHLGTYEPMSWTGEDRSVLFLGEESTLYFPDGTATTTLNAFRGYFKLTGITAGDAPTPDFVRSFVLNFGDEAAAIADAEANSSFFTLHSSFSEGWFTLDGRRLSRRPTVPGIYVKDGRKVVTK